MRTGRLGRCVAVAAVGMLVPALAETAATTAPADPSAAAGAGTAAPTAAPSSIVAAGTGAATTSRNVAGPPPGHTGGFGEPTCLVCHNEFGLNELGGRLSVEGLPAAYQAGASYSLTVRLETDGMAVGGFQMAARFLAPGREGRSAGSWEPLDGAVTVTPDSVNGTLYVHQTPAGSAVSDPALATWSVLWHAPDDAGGDVAVHAAANSGNGDNSPFGDLIYTFAAEVPASAALLHGQGVPGIHPGSAARR